MDPLEELMQAVLELDDAVFNDPSLALQKDITNYTLMSKVAKITNAAAKLHESLRPNGKE